METKAILLVEDDRDDRELIRLALKEANVPCQVETVFDGVELADYLFGTGIHENRDLRQMPDLILLDMKMPKLNGCQVLQMLRRVRGQPCLPPIVVFTSSDDSQDVRDAYAAGANSYIRKPVAFHEFVQTIKQVAFYWLKLNEPPRAPRLSLQSAHHGQ